MPFFVVVVECGICNELVITQNQTELVLTKLRPCRLVSVIRSEELEKKKQQKDDLAASRQHDLYLSREGLFL
jgi:hypothetical protein